MKKFLFFGFYNLLSSLAFPFFLVFMLWAYLSKPIYRRNMAQRFGFYPARFFQTLEGRKTFWIHASSVGEVMMSRPFIQSLRAKYPDAGILFSTMTPTGQATAREQLAHEVDLFIYFPFDFFWIASSVVSKIRPSLFIFLETEIWPNVLQSLAVYQIPALLANGRISKKSFPRYQSFSGFLSFVFKNVSLFLMQSEEDAERIIALGAHSDRVEDTGNMKYDQAILADDERENLAINLSDIGLNEGHVLMIAGSTRPGEEGPVLDAYQILQKKIPSLALVIAPRHLTRLDEIEKLFSERQVPSVLKSKISKSLPKTLTEPLPVILLDTLGELARLYSLGRYIFVGGGLSNFGGQNPLEAAACQKPVFFGPHMQNFQKITKQLIHTGGGIEVESGKDLGQQMFDLSEHPEIYEKKGRAAYEVVLKHRGAVRRNMRRLAPLIEEVEADQGD